MTRLRTRRLSHLAALTMALAGMAFMASTNAAVGPYATRGSCAGFPRVDLQTPPGFCVALLADGSSGLRFPRRLLEVSPGRFWLVDMGSWELGRGRLLEFKLSAPKQHADPLTFTVLAEKLDRPLGLALGPDGRVWLGEAGRVSRIAIGPAGSPVRLETIIGGLPASGAHPLKEIAFGANGKLYLKGRGMLWPGNSWTHGTAIARAGIASCASSWTRKASPRARLRSGSAAGRPWPACARSAHRPAWPSTRTGDFLSSRTDTRPCSCSRTNSTAPQRSSRPATIPACFRSLFSPRKAEPGVAGSASIAAR